VSEECGFQRKGNRHENSDVCWLKRSDQRRKVAECKSRQDFESKNQGFSSDRSTTQTRAGCEVEGKKVCDCPSCQNTTGALEADD
jgi:hypothetical protein